MARRGYSISLVVVPTFAVLLATQELPRSDRARRTEMDYQTRSGLWLNGRIFQKEEPGAPRVGFRARSMETSGVF